MKAEIEYIEIGTGRTIARVKKVVIGGIDFSSYAKSVSIKTDEAGHVIAEVVLGNLVVDISKTKDGEDV